MQKILGYMRKAIQEFHMIEDGDRIAVGVSGGKDSLVLLSGLIGLRRFIGIDYTVTAITLDPRFGGVPGDYGKVERLCADAGVEYRLIPTNIGQVVFDIRRETNPCSLCAKMRRGALHEAAKAAGCNKLALGHHYNDAVETFMMNLLIEGRIGCFAPVSYLSRRDLTMIRPMVLTPEKEIIRAADRLGLETVKSKCPADGHTQRQKTKELLAELEKNNRGVTARIFGAMRRSKVDGWAGEEYKDYVNKCSVRS
ncbi:MAG: tRNA 2-thiocytidine(32) synthetase TtcA [Ruminococcus sp.]|nr:tRNA 2-thiocytidine(32) synthetase TtcA [Ruminococcus sp.]